MEKLLLFVDGGPLVLQGGPRRLRGLRTERDRVFVESTTEVQSGHATEVMAWHPGSLPLFEANRPDMVHLQAVGKQDRFPFWMDRQASFGPLDEVVE